MVIHALASVTGAPPRITCGMIIEPE